jgi:hypothetical protein
MTYRVSGEEGGKAWLQQLRPICPRMARIFVKPTWVGLLDFESRFPSAIERAVAAIQHPMQNHQGEESNERRYQ